MMLLSRNEFRKQIFERDKHKCVICGSPGKDAHHIMERRLFEGGGYYLDNGATLCEEHHLDAERTILSCDDIRAAANITRTVLPFPNYGEVYDKWGNVLLANGLRSPGPLIEDESVRKILGPEVLKTFTLYMKYPRTPHLPWSHGRSKDDKVLKNMPFEGKQVVVTEKMDGENTTMYQDYIHARSLNNENHPSRNWVKNLHAKIGWMIPKGWRVCGENMYAVHSIKYTALPSYFLVFAIFNEKECLSWDETVEWANLLELETVPPLHRGLWNEDIVKKCFNGQSQFGSVSEGYIVRTTDKFHYREFNQHVAKFVRENHITSETHWRLNYTIEKNQMKR